MRFARGLCERFDVSWQVPSLKGAELNLFLCSSAGEYDQALPVIQKLNDMGEKSLVMFVSISGVKYRAVSDHGSPYCLAKNDSILFWRKVQKYYLIQRTFVVRHEYWPGFLYVFSKDHLYLICWSFYRTRLRWFKRLYQAWVMKQFSKIFAVDERSIERALDFSILTEAQKSQWVVSGDPKYARALQKVKSIPKSKKAPFRLIIGSAWPADVKLLLESIGILQQENLWSKGSQLVVVPHDLSVDNLEKIIKLTQSAQLRVTILDKWRPDAHEPGILIIQSMGELSTIYAYGNAVFVGGSVDRRVHNILEPLAYRVPINFSVRYQTALEAAMLAEERGDIVVENPSQLARWITQAQSLEYQNEWKTYCDQFFAKRLGSAERIYENL